MKENCDFHAILTPFRVVVLKVNCNKILYVCTKVLMVCIKVNLFLFYTVIPARL